MIPVRIAAVSVNQTPLAWDENRANILAGLQEARAAGASLVCFPELCISGYGCEDAFLWPATAQMAWRVLEELLPETQGLVVAVGLPLAFEGAVYNAVAVICDGAVVGVCCKRHLARDGLHYEPRWFQPWPSGRRSQVIRSGQTIPIGDLLFDVGGVRVGVEICEDAWVKNRPAFELGRAGAALILGPSASHFAFSKHLKRRKLALAGAHCVQGYVYCNLLGNEAGRAIYDGDSLIVSGGARPHVVAEARRLSFRTRQLTCATLLLRRTVVHPAGDDPERGVISVHFTFPSEPRTDVLTERTAGADATGYMPKREAMARAIPLGLFDYLRKSHSQGFVVSLSGGADSAAVALMVRLMVRLGCDELGVSGFIERLPFLAAQSAPEDGWTEPKLTARLLLTVYQGGANSSEVTRTAAREVARALGAEHHELQIDGLVAAYQNAVEQVLERPLSWEHDDIALQNIQARVRSPSVWMLANVRGALLLCTSNRSEAAVGYATMDGDTSGGLCPIGGVDKAFLRQWLVFMEQTGIPDFPPLPALSLINAQHPTAELRPQDQGQTDEEDLMPYPVLDAIERAAVIDRLAPAEVLRRVAADFPAHRHRALEWVTRFYRLFAANQWKRERYAPSFHVDDGNLDPKTWCRFPILSGGFQRELSELAQLSDPES